MKVFLMMGQSNMAGRGDPADVAPLPSTHAFVLRCGRWQPMTEPLNIDRPIKFSGKMGTNSGIGPAASFAAAYAAQYHEDIGLVPCADGGTSLAEWAVDGQLFLHAYYMARLAANVGDLMGILWHQGEAESGDPTLAHSYESRFLHIMTEFQSRLGVSLDIVVGELGRFFTAPYAADVNRALHHLADTHDRIAIASSEGLTDRGDAVHFTAQSQREFGRRYFEAWKRVRDLDNRPVR